MHLQLADQAGRHRDLSNARARLRPLHAEPPGGEVNRPPSEADRLADSQAAEQLHGQESTVPASCSQEFASLVSVKPTAMRAPRLQAGAPSTGRVLTG